MTTPPTPVGVHMTPASTPAPLCTLTFPHLPFLDETIIVLREAATGSQSEPLFSLLGWCLLYPAGPSLAPQALCYGSLAVSVPLMGNICGFFHLCCCAYASQMLFRVDLKHNINESKLLHKLNVFLTQV